MSTKPQLGQKILVLGVSASGKSTFARRICEITKLPLFHMDEIMWRPGWNYIGDEATHAKLKEISLQNTWIIEGYITKAARAELFAAADTILYLDYSGHLSAWRYVKRWWTHRKQPRQELPGSPEKFSYKFLKLVYTKGETQSLEKYFSEAKVEGKMIRFDSPKEANIFLQKFQP